MSPHPGPILKGIGRLAVLRNLGIPGDWALTNAVPSEVDTLARKVSTVLSHIKLTDLLLEVDVWTEFTQHFVHFRNGDVATDRTLLPTAILADAINLGLDRMADACPGTSLSLVRAVRIWLPGCPPVEGSPQMRNRLPDARWGL